MPPSWTLDDAEDLYGTGRWGEGYFRVGNDGRLHVTPTRDAKLSTSITSIIESLVARGYDTPISLRFPQILEDRIRNMHETFRASMQEYGYQGDLRLVYPMKVNQRRELVLELLDVGAKYHYGLEAGSKPEILAAMACDTDPKSLLVINGFKDEEFIELAVAAVELGKTVIVVMDKVDEAELLVRVLKDVEHKPFIGVRVKLLAKGGGKWIESSGERAKFGLTVPEVVHAMEVLKAGGLADRMKMVHFHIGSQITDIKRVHAGVVEAGRIYASLRKMGFPVDTIDTGGGLGVDYDGSGTASQASRNYDLREYTNTIVYSLREVADEAGVPHPTIVTESGRAVAAYQGLLAMELLKRMPEERPLSEAEPAPGDHKIVHDMRATLDNITIKNYPEAYHDAIALKDELTQRFNFGMVTLGDRGKAEIMFRHIARKVLHFAERDDNLLDEFLELKKLLQQKYIGNFSLFQSTPDIWGVKQLFPIMPLDRLKERPTEFGTIVDITCDSDGEIRKFIDVMDVKDTLELHELDERPYYVGVFLTGAYQDTLGDFHNLFGRVHEAYVRVTEDGGHTLDKFVEGDSVEEVLWLVNWQEGELYERMCDVIEKKVVDGRIAADRASEVKETFKAALEGYTYLEKEAVGAQARLHERMLPPRGAESR
ncbi:MAG: biosynthetic arginine decarboxylase [Euryarchaeota archaeon]|nr:biosynthetic arginine decarboxylase [Euryarchaeota archaeon]